MREGRESALPLSGCIFGVEFLRENNKLGTGFARHP